MDVRRYTGLDFPVYKHGLMCNVKRRTTEGGRIVRQYLAQGMRYTWFSFDKTYGRFK